MSKRDEILSNLTNNLPVIEQPKTDEIIAHNGPSDEHLINDAQEDFEYARARIKKLIDTSDDAIARMYDLASDAEHPRAFEVLGTLIKQTAEINGQLLDLQKQRKLLIKGDKDVKENSSSNTTNNAIFVGSTTDLQKFLFDQKNNQTIDIDN
jgi:hypothetical protein